LALYCKKLLHNANVDKQMYKRLLWTFQLHEFPITSSWIHYFKFVNIRNSWIHDFSFTNSRFQLYEFMISTSGIYDYNLMNSRFQLYEINFTNSRISIHFTNLKSWIREVGMSPPVFRTNVAALILYIETLINLSLNQSHFGIRPSCL
jgi:hypothetical protein